MEEIILQQRNLPKPVTGKAFILNVAAVIVKLALAQIAVNLLITLTGMGLLNIAFYLYAVYALISFMSRTVAGSTYTLKKNTLVLQKMLGDSTISVTEIPLEHILSVRPVAYGERLESSYQYVQVMDASAAAPVRMRLAYGLSLISASLARKAAGKRAGETRGCIVAYQQEGKRQACVFLPDEAFQDALQAALPEVYGADERTRENTKTTMMAQALERAFPPLYVHVEPLVSPEKAEAAKQEIERQKKAAQAPKQADSPANGQNDEEAGKAHEVQDDTL